MRRKRKNNNAILALTIVFLIVFALAVWIFLPVKIESIEFKEIRYKSEIGNVVCYPWATYPTETISYNCTIEG
jgi:hypothetical protein